MRANLLIILITFFAACQHTDNKNGLTCDTLPTKLDKKQESIKTKLDSFLLNPFDLYKFKKIKGGSNSGSASRKSYYLLPNYKGFYYRFFLFPPAKAYLGASKQNIVEIENGLSMVTFKSFGNHQHEYLDSSEVLIELCARYNDFNLPEFAFIGLDTTEIINKLGDKFIVKENCIIYSYIDKILTLRFENGKIKWLKYVQLDSAFSADKKYDKLFE